VSARQYPELLLLRLRTHTNKLQVTTHSSATAQPIRAITPRRIRRAAFLFHARRCMVPAAIFPVRNHASLSPPSISRKSLSSRPEA